MNELSMNTVNIASVALSCVFLIVGLIAWFYVNRASVRATEQVVLLEALLEQQKRQNALLRRLCEDKLPAEAAPMAVDRHDSDDENDFVRLVAER